MAKRTETRNKIILDEYLRGNTDKDELAKKYSLTRRSIDRILFMETSKQMPQEATEAARSGFEGKDDKTHTDDKKFVYWEVDGLISEKAQYYMALSNRGPGKTYSVLKRGLKRYIESGYKKEMCYIRRYDDDLRPGKAGRCFSNIVRNGEVEKLTDGKFNTIVYKGHSWYLGRNDEGAKYISPVPFCHGFSINNQDDWKSAGFPDVKTIVTDEFITDHDEANPQIFKDWKNLINTIIRSGTVLLEDGTSREMTKEELEDIEIFLLGNMVNTDSIFLEEMGLHDVINQEVGTIATYKYPGNVRTTVRVEVIKNLNKSKPTDIFFEAFEGNSSGFIISTGWDIPEYPGKPMDFDKEDILVSFFIDYAHCLMKCDIIEKDDSVFIFVTKKTTLLKYPDDELVYRTERTPKPTSRCNIYTPETNYERKILELINTGRVYFQSNEIGNKFYNYLKWCGSTVK